MANVNKRCIFLFCFEKNTSTIKSVFDLLVDLFDSLVNDFISEVTEISGLDHGSEIGVDLLDVSNVDWHLSLSHDWDFLSLFCWLMKSFEILKIFSHIKLVFFKKRTYLPDEENELGAGGFLDLAWELDISKDDIVFLAKGTSVSKTSISLSLDSQGLVVLISKGNPVFLLIIFCLFTMISINVVYQLVSDPAVRISLYASAASGGMTSDIVFERVLFSLFELQK